MAKAPANAAVSVSGRQVGRLLFGVAGCAIMLVLLMRSSSPLMRQQSSTLSGLAYFFAGCAFTVVVLCLGLVLLFFGLTTRHEPLPKPALPVQLDAEIKRQIKCSKTLRKQLAMAQQQQQLWLAGSKPQPRVYSAGRLTGTLWTIPVSVWPRSKQPEHPPPSEGPEAIAHRWHAVLADNVLTLTLATPKEPKEPTAEPTKVEIRLAGCSCIVVQECLVQLDGRKMGPWHKRGALELSHPEQQLVYGDHNVFLYAETGAAKEQWHLALVAESQPTCNPAAVRSAYHVFCNHMVQAAETLGLPQPPPSEPPPFVFGLDSKDGKDVNAGKQQKQQHKGQQQKDQQQQGNKQGGRKFGFGWLGKLIPGRRGNNQQDQQQDKDKDKDHDRDEHKHKDRDKDKDSDRDKDRIKEKEKEKEQEGKDRDKSKEIEKDREKQKERERDSQQQQQQQNQQQQDSSSSSKQHPEGQTEGLQGADTTIQSASKGDLATVGAGLAVSTENTAGPSSAVADGMQLPVLPTLPVAELAAANEAAQPQPCTPQAPPAAELRSHDLRCASTIWSESSMSRSTARLTSGGPNALCFERSEDSSSSNSTMGGSAMPETGSRAWGSSAALSHSPSTDAGLAAGVAAAPLMSRLSRSSAGGLSSRATTADVANTEQPKQSEAAADVSLAQPSFSLSIGSRCSGVGLVQGAESDNGSDEQPVLSAAKALSRTMTEATVEATAEATAEALTEAMAEPSAVSADPEDPQVPACSRSAAGLSSSPAGRMLQLPVMPLLVDWPSAADEGEAQRPLQLQEQDVLSRALLPSPRGMVASSSVPDLRQSLSGPNHWASLQDLTDVRKAEPSAEPSPAKQSKQSDEAKQRAKALALQEQRLKQAAKRREEDARRQQQQEQQMAKRANREAADRLRQAAKEQARAEKQQQGEARRRLQEQEKQDRQVREQRPKHQQQQDGGSRGVVARSASDGRAAGPDDAAKEARPTLPHPASFPGIHPTSGQGEAAGSAAPESQAQAGASIDPLPEPSAVLKAAAGITREADARGPLVAALLALNMVVARVGFEVLGAHRLERWLHRLVQSKLDEFKRPAYLHRLVLETLDLGNAFPMLRDLRGVSTNAGNGIIWPQVVADLAFSGRVTLVISTTVELQQAGLIRKLQSAFGRMAGLGSASSGGAAERDEPAGGSPRAGAGKPSDAGAGGMAADGNVRGGSRASSSGNLQQQADGAARQRSSGGATAGAASDPASLVQQHHQQPEPSPFANSGGGGGNLLTGLLGLSRAAVTKAGNLAAGLTDVLPRVSCQLEICIRRFECEMMAWAPPPPSDRVWLCFAAPPVVDITTRPLFGNRILRYSVVLGQVSALLKDKIVKALNKSMVYPAAVDVRLGFWANPGVTNDDRWPPPNAAHGHAHAQGQAHDAPAGDQQPEPEQPQEQQSQQQQQQQPQPEPLLPQQQHDQQQPLLQEAIPLVPPSVGEQDLASTFNQLLVPLVCTDPALHQEGAPAMPASGALPAQPAMPLPPGLMSCMALPPRPSRPMAEIAPHISAPMPAPAAAPTPCYAAPVATPSAPPAAEAPLPPPLPPPAPPIAHSNSNHSNHSGSSHHSNRKGFSLAFRFRPFRRGPPHGDHKLAGHSPSNSQAPSAWPGNSPANSLANSRVNSLANSRVGSVRGSLDVGGDIDERL